MIDAVLTAAVALTALAVLAVSAFRHLPRAVALGLSGILFICAVAWPISRATRTLHEEPVPLTDVAYETSQTCVRCHPAHYDSWAATYHRTMTQEPEPKRVLGTFDGSTVRLQDGAARMFRDGDRFFMELIDVGDSVSPVGLKPGIHQVQRLVGSHEMQVYLTRQDDGTYLTLPFEWNQRDRRWVTSPGNYLEPPSDAGLLASSARWNSDCAFCHNTRANPGAGRGTGFSTTVAELGIACEACHGPGHEHVSRNQSPARRHVLHLAGRSDPTIVNPQRLDTQRSMEICGRCHGKWFPRPEQMATVYKDGEPFVPGQSRLHAHYEDPLRLSSRGEDVSGFFWPDLTPRPTSMEYQGVLLSECHDKGEMGCDACHSMHNAAPDDQLRFVDDPATPNHEDNKMCTQCHHELDAALHSHHRTDSSGSRCASCHMPFQTFGLMKAVRSHRITVPSMVKTERIGLPNACTQCHVDRSLRWAARQMDRWWERNELAELRSHSALPSTVVELTGGHALTRALAAHALGSPESVIAGDNGDWRFSVLAGAMEDPYAAVRKLAADSFTALRSEPVEFDYNAPPAIRAAQLRALEPSATAPPGAEDAPLATLERDETPITVLE